MLWAPVVIDEGDSVPLSVGTVVVQMIYIHIRPRWHTQHEHSSVSSYCIFTSQQRSGEDGDIKQLHLAFSAGLLKESQLQTCAQFEHSCHHTPAWVLPDFLPVTTCYGVIMVCFYLIKPRGDTDASTKKNTSQTHGVQLKIDLFYNQK